MKDDVMKKWLLVFKGMPIKILAVENHLREEHSCAKAVEPHMGHGTRFRC